MFFIRMGSVIEQFRRISDSEDSDDESDFVGVIESVDGMDAKHKWVSFMTWSVQFSLLSVMGKIKFVILLSLSIFMFYVVHGLCYLPTFEN